MYGMADSSAHETSCGNRGAWDYDGHNWKICKRYITTSEGERVKRASHWA